MTIRRASVILPCRRLDDFPTHVSGQAAAELLGAWTGLWHPALIHATGQLPGWHPADDPPVPAGLDGELVLVPSVSQLRLPSAWFDELRSTMPRNPPPVETLASREATVSAALAAAGAESPVHSDGIVRDFLALGYAHLQVELLTRAMHYATVLDDVQFTCAVVEAANAAMSGNLPMARDELARAFDLLMDARNHAYAVDHYVVDVTLLARSTMGEPLRKKLADGLPTSLLATGELIAEMAADHPETLNELRRAIGAGTACVFGGLQSGGPTAGQPPEAILAQLSVGRDSIRRHLGYDVTVFGQFEAGFSRILPEILHGSDFQGVLHAAFDGGRLPRAQQRKTRWGPRDGPQIDALAATPLDVARPATWLKLAERIGDTIAHDHVATILLAGWPGHAAEYYEDMRRAAQYGTVLGKPVTLDEYFRITREVEDWSVFDPSEYSTGALCARPNVISRSVDVYRRAITENYQQLFEGLSSIMLSGAQSGSTEVRGESVVINPWNFASAKFFGFDPLAAAESRDGHPTWLPEVPGCGYTMLEGRSTSPPQAALADGRTLRNERLEVVVSETTGGIQSLKTHRDRNTRASQRLVYQDELTARRSADAYRDQDVPARLDTQMVAEGVEITRNEAVVGEITSRGRLTDATGEVLARFRQSVRLARGLPAVIVDVELDVERRPDGDVWDSYFASRLAWAGDAESVRRGVEWAARASTRSRIESPEWVEVSGSAGTVTSFGCGLPLHRLSGPTWLDTLLVVDGEERRRFQFAVGLDCAYPTQGSLALLTAGISAPAPWPAQPTAPCGWFVHIGAKNLIVTHIEPLPAGRAGIRLRLLETEGREARTKLSAFRPFRVARSTDFLGQSTGLLSVDEGQVRLEIGPYRWVQIEAEW